MPTPAPLRAPSAGFTLVELMVSMAVGLLLLAGMATMFVANNRAQAEIEKANRQVENGRYAIQLLSSDLANAGFYGHFDPTPMASPAAVPAVCGPTLANLRTSLAIPVQGVDVAAPADHACLTGLKANTDVLVVRRVQTCVAGQGNCAAAASGGVLFQASLCMLTAELGSTDATNHFALDTNVDNLDRRKRDCALAGGGTKADVRRFVTHIYYIATEHESGDGIPTLMRAELGAPAGGAPALSVMPMVEGVENMQFEYGLDTDSNGTPDLYAAAPATANGCTDAACAVANWRSVVAVKLHLLARNTVKTGGHVDNKKYILGRNAAGADIEIAAAKDAYKRHVFQSTAAIQNTAGRRIP